MLARVCVCVNVVPSPPVVPAAPCRRHPTLSAVNLSFVAAEPARGHTHKHTHTQRRGLNVGDW